MAAYSTAVPKHGVLFLIAALAFIPASTLATHRRLDFVIDYLNVSRLCHTKALVAVNGMYPGPTLRVREGDHVIVNVTNLVSYNLTLHWHGVRQLLSAWADGPAYVTQCPLQTGQSYVYRFQIVDQRGTLFWHAHISWLRATVHGAIVIRPRHKTRYPFVKPNHEYTMILGEWWNANVEDIIADALRTGGGYNISDALTINGYPGALYNCSEHLTQVFNVEEGERYLLRLVNAAVNFQLFFAIANHSLTVVEADAEYTQPLETQVVVLAPGQTTNVLVRANKPTNAENYYIAISVFSPANEVLVPYPEIPATAILTYNSSLPPNISFSELSLPSFPAFNDKSYVANFTQSLRGQYYSKGYYYYNIPLKIDYDLFFTVGYSLQPCANCSSGFPGERLSASINNHTFETPSISILQAYYEQISGVYNTTFPDVPPYTYNYTGIGGNDISTSVLGTYVKVLEFGQSVQIVFQDTASLLFESHPIHLHGQNFYIVGSGFGDFNASSDPDSFNLRDPPSRNTVAVPSGGWAAVRFTTTNPGVWFMHCHIDLHTSWGMTMAFIVKNGVGSDQTLPPPPSDFPAC